MKKISKDSWHFRFVVATHDRWLKGYDDLNIADRYYLNLCPYLRDVLIWAPLVWLGGILYTVTIWPFKYLAEKAYWAYAKRTYVIVNGKIQLDTWDRKLRLHPKPEKPVKRRKGPGLWSLVGNWLEAKHDKICPRIQVVDSIEPPTP